MHREGSQWASTLLIGWLYGFMGVIVATYALITLHLLRGPHWYEAPLIALPMLIAPLLFTAWSTLVPIIVMSFAVCVISGLKPTDYVRWRRALPFAVLLGVSVCRCSTVISEAFCVYDSRRPLNPDWQWLVHLHGTGADRMFLFSAIVVAFLVCNGRRRDRLTLIAASLMITLPLLTESIWIGTIFSMSKEQLQFVPWFVWHGSSCATLALGISLAYHWRSKLREKDNRVADKPADVPAMDHD